MLVLGPYSGESTEYVRIPFGKGICGQAADSGETFVVDDVSTEDNYLSCSVSVRSEIVIPLVSSDGELLGELDIDSHTPRGFPPEDVRFLEWVASRTAVHVEESLGGHD